jgi:hypothetical protein
VLDDLVERSVAFSIHGFTADLRYGCASALDVMVWLYSNSNFEKISPILQAFRRGM